MYNNLKINDYSDVEIKIIEAANKVFLQFGVEASTMQQIAQEADISRTALHYYFRNKSQLYDCIIEILSNRIIPKLSSIILSDASVVEKVEMFIDNYIDLVMEFPMVPGFVLAEMQKNTNRVLNVIENKLMDTDIVAFQLQMKKEIEENLLNDVTLIDIISNVMGLCVFPVVGRALYLKFVFEGDKDDYMRYLNGRKKVVAEVVRRWLVPLG